MKAEKVGKNSDLGLACVGLWLWVMALGLWGLELWSFGVLKFEEGLWLM